MGLSARIVWGMRRGLWNFIATVKFKNNEPLAILPVPGRFEELTAVPFRQRYPSIPVQFLQVASRTPEDERRPRLQYFKKVMMFVCQRALCKVFSPMQHGLSPVDFDLQVALAEGFRSRHNRTAERVARKRNLSAGVRLRRPVVPLELQGVPDLGLLAVQGPYAAYLRRTEEEIYEWDLRWLSNGGIACHPGLVRPWAAVRFRTDQASRRLRPTSIATELGIVHPEHPLWPRAVQVALCAAGTHTGLIRHWNWLHLTVGESVALATRRTFPPHHPICRLLWPHVYGTHQSNYFGNVAQLRPGGDFEQVYSLTHAGICAAFDAAGADFRMDFGDPVADAERRGLAGSGLDLPTQRNMVALFRVMERHAERYVRLYYASDSDVRADPALQEWVKVLGRFMPHAGLGPLESKAQLVALVARFIHLVTAYHESVGALLWNYQLWTGIHPIRVYHDGRREPIDVFQRLVNMNYLLHVVRARLVDDYAGLALVEPTNPARTEQAREAFRAFRRDLEALQRVMEAEPRSHWTIYPVTLEASINA